MEKRERRDRISMNGFFAAVRLNGSYHTYELVDISDHGIGVHVPVDTEIVQDEEYDVRFEVIDSDYDYDAFSLKRSNKVRKETVSAMGKVKWIREKDGMVKHVGLEMDYISSAEKKDMESKVKHAREALKRLVDFPKVHVQFGFQVEEQARDERLRGYKNYEGLYATEDHTLSFLIDADLEHLFLEDDYVSVKLPIENEGRYMVVTGNIISNQPFNMLNNIITVKLDNSEDENEIIDSSLRRFVLGSNDILKFRYSG